MVKHLKLIYDYAYLKCIIQQLAFRIYSSCLTNKWICFLEHLSHFKMIYTASPEIFVCAFEATDFYIDRLRNVIIENTLTGSKCHFPKMFQY